MNEFLRKNKDLFSSKREFLTKLREVRQKLMNKINSNTITTTTTVASKSNGVNCESESSPSLEKTQPEALGETETTETRKNTDN